MLRVPFHHWSPQSLRALALPVFAQNEQGYNSNDYCEDDARSEVEGVQDGKPRPIETDRDGVAVSVHQRLCRRSSPYMPPLKGWIWRKTSTPIVRPYLAYLGKRLAAAFVELVDRIGVLQGEPHAVVAPRLGHHSTMAG